MLMSVECKFCWGTGRLHSPGCNGDPDDEGAQCPKCDGAGCVDIDLDEEAEE